MSANLDAKQALVEEIKEKLQSSKLNMVVLIF